MTRLAELYEEWEDAQRTMSSLLFKLNLEPELEGRINMAIEDVKSRIREIDDEIFDLERKDGVIGAQG